MGMPPIHNINVANVWHSDSIYYYPHLYFISPFNLVSELWLLLILRIGMF